MGARGRPTVNAGETLPAVSVNLGAGKAFVEHQTARKGAGEHVKGCVLDATIKLWCVTRVVFGVGEGPPWRWHSVLFHQTATGFGDSGKTDTALCSSSRSIRIAALVL